MSETKYAIQPVMSYGDHVGVVAHDQHADFFGVYIVKEDGTSEWVMDFPTREEAEAYVAEPYPLRTDVETIGDYHICPEKNLLPADADETHYVSCPAEEAEIWALYLKVDDTYEWLSDYNTRNLAAISVMQRTDPKGIQYADEDFGYNVGTITFDPSLEGGFLIEKLDGTDAGRELAAKLKYGKSYAEVKAEWDAEEAEWEAEQAAKKAAEEVGNEETIEQG